MTRDAAPPDLSRLLDAPPPPPTGGRRLLAGAAGGLLLVVLAAALALAVALEQRRAERLAAVEQRQQALAQALARAVADWLDDALPGGLVAEAVALGPVRAGADGLRLEAVPAAGAEGNARTRTVAVGAGLQAVLAPGALAQPGERARLVQTVDGRVQEIRADEGRLVTLRGLDGRDVPFAMRGAVRGEGPVFSLGVAVPGTDWLVVQEIDAGAALAPVAAFRRAAVGGTALGALLLAAGVGAYWWQRYSEHNRRLAEHYRDLAARVDAQRQVFDGINNAVREHIGLKGPDGRYHYVNPAFAAALGRPAAEVLGLDDAAIFGAEGAAVLAALDARAVETGEAHAPEAEFLLDGRPHILEISRARLLAPAGTVKGIVTVARDVTQLAQQRRARERARENTIAALVHTVEMSDPHLAGHARLVRRYALAIAEAMDLPERDRATLDIAATLAQVGKLSVPREILAKPGRLSPEEITVMQSHVEHASRVLRDIDFDGLPVHDTVYAMYERLDGQGYPRGLKNGEIPLLARILGAADVFAARIRPRSYRAPIGPDEALSVLAMNAPARYDPEVVAALRAVLDGEAGAPAPEGATDADTLLLPNGNE